MSGLLTRFGRDKRGVSAVEFALIAPVLVTFYLGLAELTQGLMADRRIGHAAAAVGDLVAQSSTINTSKLNDIYIIAEKILEPFPATDLKIRVSSVSQDSAGVKKLEWSSAKNMTALTTVPTLPTGVLANSQSVIVAEVTYKYDSPVDYFAPNGIQLDKKYYLRPRKSDKVTKTG